MFFVVIQSSVYPRVWSRRLWLAGFHACVLYISIINRNFMFEVIGYLLLYKRVITILITEIKL